MAELHPSIITHLSPSRGEVIVHRFLARTLDSRPDVLIRYDRRVADQQVFFIVVAFVLGKDDLVAVVVDGLCLSSESLPKAGEVLTSTSTALSADFPPQVAAFSTQ